MEEMLKNFNISYDILNVLEGKNITVKHKNFVIGRFTIVVIKGNASKEFKKDLEDIAEYYKTQGKQLLIIKEYEVASFSKLFKILTYLSEYNNNNQYNLN